MDKTIINGIDVSECKHHYTNPVNGIIYHGCAIYEQINELGFQQDTLCEQNPDCYFKQLKRLEQKNKYLINEVGRLGHYIETHYPSKDFLVDNVIKQNISLEQENKELKEKIKSANCPYYDNGDCSCMGEVKDVYKYKQTLEEIKAEIGDLKDINKLINLQKILDKINEILK